MTDTAMQMAKAAFKAADDLMALHNARMAADARYQALEEHVAIFTPGLPRHGWDGFSDVVTGLMSARHWRTLRAKSLMMARMMQLSPDPRLAGASWFWLRKAAGQRKTERMYRDAERRAEYRGLIMGAAGYSTTPSDGEMQRSAAE